MKTMISRTSLFALTLIVGAFAYSNEGSKDSTATDLGVSTSDSAATETETETETSETGKAASSPVVIDNVETLMDQATRYNNQKVSVKGEVEKVLDSSSFILEGGGMINDEVLVVKGKNLKAEDFKRAKEEKDMTVVGTLRTVPIMEIRNELSWDLDPQLEAELQRVKVFLVAEDVREADSTKN